jgi:hypothetical protein
VVAGNLPLENGYHIGRLFGCKDIYFLPKVFWLSVFDKNFFQKDFVKVVLPGKHQFVCCLVLILGRYFVNVHDGKEWHVLFLLSVLFFVTCCAHGALACQEKQSGLDRTVEAMCENVTKNSERQPERQPERRKEAFLSTKLLPLDLPLPLHFAEAQQEAIQEAIPGVIACVS